jgi:hypothetical protein
MHEMRPKNFISTCTKPIPPVVRITPVLLAKTTILEACTARWHRSLRPLVRTPSSTYLRRIERKSSPSINAGTRASRSGKEGEFDTLRHSPVVGTLPNTYNFGKFPRDDQGRQSQDFPPF